MKSKKKVNKNFIIFLVLFFAIFITLYSFSTKILVKIGETYYRAILSTASYFAIEETLKNKINYEDLFEIEKDDSGNITMIKANSYKFNALTVQFANNVSYFISKEVNNGVPVPIGAFTGITLLSGFGKKVNMPLISINSVKCEIISTFLDGGVNQTKHSLYLDIIPDVSIVTRFTSKNLVDNIKVLLFENVIVGKVPEVYFNSSAYSSEKVF